MMTEQRDRAGHRDAGGRAPRSFGWRMRAEQAYGELSPARSWTLSASEIGAYAFCPQAWFLQRCRLPVSDETEARRRAGSQAHRAIGRQTDLVRVAGALRTILLLAIGVLLVLLVALVLRGLG
ncbi:MAG: PD-(D/E)XK nuclease family protein [Chloroflexota bacterium]|nr:PD-(D/E)XK nuclease family protein [Chloroflexota bacterium]